jgi:chromosome segregation ATPase
VDHSETWSLPIVGRKGDFQPPAAEVATAYGGAVRKSAALKQELELLRRSHQEAVERANKLEAEIEARTHWARKVEGELEDRTEWAMALKQEKETALADFARGVAEAENAQRHIHALEKDLAEARAAREALETRLWTRAGRRLGAL